MLQLLLNVKWHKRNAEIFDDNSVIHIISEPGKNLKISIFFLFSTYKNKYNTIMIWSAVNVIFMLSTVEN